MVAELEDLFLDGSFHSRKGTLDFDRRRFITSARSNRPRVYLKTCTAPFLQPAAIKLPLFDHETARTARGSLVVCARSTECGAGKFHTCGRSAGQRLERFDRGSRSRSSPSGFRPERPRRAGTASRFRARGRSGSPRRRGPPAWPSSGTTRGSTRPRSRRRGR